MNPGPLDLLVRANSDFAITLTWKDSAGTPVDLTGKTASSRIKDADGNTILDMTHLNHITLGGVAGTIAIAIDKSIVSTWTFTEPAEWDLLIGDDCVVAGQVILSKGVTP